jgi:hypothetical protein
MRNGFLASILTVLLGGGVARSQPDGPTLPASAAEAGDGWTSAQATKAADAKAKDLPAKAADATLPPPGAGKSDAKSEAPPPAGPVPGLVPWQGQRPCGPPGKYWASAEYLLWWTRDDHLPPLVTTALPPGTGALGNPGTAILLGGDVDYGPRSGARLTAGMWLDDGQAFGLEASTFCLLSDSRDDALFSPGFPVLARPFYDVATGAPNSQLVAFPGLAAGGVSVSSFMSKLQGCEADAICSLKCCTGCDSGCPSQGGRLDLLAGVRYLYLREGLTITETVVVPPAFPAAGAFPTVGGLPFAGGGRIGVEDQFRTQNRFYGGQVGLRGEYAFGDGLFVRACGKVALGVMEQEVDVRGSTAVVTPAGAAAAPGGLWAQPSNIGHFERDRFAAVSELTLNVGYQVNSHVRVFVGYTYLYVTNVVRPGDAIDPRVNSTRVRTSLVPAFAFRDSDFWAQGLSLGAEIRY